MRRTGEFVFVTVSWPLENKRELWTLFGYGYHEYRERWYTNEWHFYRNHPFPETLEQRVSREETEEMLQTRRDEIAPYTREDRQTGRGRLFERLADLTDDDGAIAEIDDLGDLWDILADDLM